MIWHRKVPPSGLWLRGSASTWQWRAQDTCTIHSTPPRTTQHAPPQTLHSCAEPWPCSCEGTWMRRPHWWYAVDTPAGCILPCFGRMLCAAYDDRLGWLHGSVDNIEPQKLVSFFLEGLCLTGCHHLRSCNIEGSGLRLVPAITSDSTRTNADVDLPRSRSAG